jgi:hypothetical protein
MIVGFLAFQADAIIGLDCLSNVHMGPGYCTLSEQANYQAHRIFLFYLATFLAKQFFG